MAAHKTLIGILLAHILHRVMENKVVLFAIVKIMDIAIIISRFDIEHTVEIGREGKSTSPIIKTKERI